MSNEYVLGPVIGVDLYANDAVVVRAGFSPGARDIPRCDVKEFSRKSRQRLAFVASNTSVTFRTMVTLTYPREFPSDGRQVKKHLNSFLMFVKKECSAPLYLWFLEFQRRGAPHLHILLDVVLPSGREALRDFRWRIATTWYRIVGSQDERHLAAGTRTERIRKPGGARRYAVKYAMKMRQKLVPVGYRNVGRFWGCSRAVTPIALSEHRCTEDDVRGVLEGWEYAPAEHRPVYRVLYNAADLFRQWNDAG